MNTATDYVKHGLVLVPIPRGQKGPQHAGWQQAENCITTVEAAAKINSSNIGLAHLYSHTCAIDIDNFDGAITWFEQHGMDLTGLLMREDSVQISSGRVNHAKLIYKLPDGVKSLPTYQHQIEGETVFELRCSTRKGTTVQDVLPPSIHPDTGKPYEWKGNWQHLPVLPDALLAVWPIDHHDPRDPQPLENRPEVEEALTFVNPDEYTTWLKVGMALHSTGSDEAFEIWDTWSQRGDTYRAGECREKWAGFTGAGGITLSTLFHEARKSGFEGYLGTDDAQRGKDYPTILFNDATPVLDETALIEGLLKPESFIVTYGESGSGKTFEALWRDLSVASGTPYQGRDVEQGLVVYLAAEGGNSTRNRVAAYRQQLFPEAHFALVPYSMDFTSVNGDVEPLIRYVKRLEDQLGVGCAKITQDTLARAMGGGDENSPRDMGLIVAAADRIRYDIGCAFEYIHHAGKDVARGARGHSSLKAATDTENEVTEAQGVHYMKPTKQRDFALGDEFAFRLQTVELGVNQKGQPVITCIPEPETVQQRDRKKNPTQGEKFMLDILKETMGIHQTLPPTNVMKEPGNKLQTGQKVCPASKYRQIYLSRKAPDRTKADSAERTYRRYIESLQLKGFIQVFEEWVWFLH